MGDEVASRYCIVHLLCCRNGAFASLVREIDGNIPSLARDLASAIMHCAHAVDKSVCSACAERLHEPLRDVPIWLPAGDPRKAFRHLESALRNARSATGASVGLSVEKLFAFPVEKCLRRSGKGIGRSRRISPGWRKSQEKVLWNAPRRCIAKLWTADPPMAPPSMLPSIAADFPGKPENPVFLGIMASKGKSWRHFHGHSRSAGFLWKSCWQTVPEAGRRGCPRDSADPWLGRERSSCRAPPNGCRYLVDKAVGKVLEKMPCQVAPMACRVGCFLSTADVAKIAGTIGAGGFPRSRMGSRHAVDNSVSKVVMTVLRQMLTRVRRRVARKCAAASQACPGLVPLGAGAWSVAPGASRVPGLS